MRKIVIGLLVAVLVLHFTPMLYAKTPADKLVRGLGNVASGILEIPQTMGEEWKASNNAAVGCFVGAAKGTVQALVRMFSGVWDLLTFPVAAPKDYEPLYTPDYVFDQE